MKFRITYIFKVYWKILAIGKGPTILLSNASTELMKFDCFGFKDGHYHIAPNDDTRIYFIEKSAQQQIKRSKKEILINAQRYLQIHPNPVINSIQIDMSKLTVALDVAEQKMISFLEETPELKNL